MRVAPAVAAVPLLLLLLTWLSLGALHTDAELFDRALGALDHFASVENALHRDVLSTRAGMLRNYDPLVRETNILHGSLDRLRKTAAVDAETTAAVERLAALVDQQEDLVERFKSDNALLQNSLAYFGLFSVRLGPSNENGPLVSAVSALAAAMLHLTLDTSPIAAREVADRLDELARQSPPFGSGDPIQALLAHGRVLHDLLPATDSILKALFAVPTKRDQDDLRAMVLTHQSASRATARAFRLSLYAASLLLLGLLIHIGLLLRGRALALARRAAFEHVIAGISMRFINAHPQDIDAHVQQALTQMAECVGCDRAYVILAGPSPRTYTWCRQGVTFPCGWPDRALALATRFGLNADGLMHIPYVSRLPPGKDKDACIAFDLGGFACATCAENGADMVLGFDALRRPCRITQPGELGLMRMALDTIVHAVGRQVMDQEKARLETRLQQARRMETVGAFSSGIAHNFNNIVGAILGYAEMAEAQVAPNSRPARNLGEIRRAGARARDLVDQILAFGRRRGAHAGSVGVRELIAETASMLRASLPPGVELVVHEAPEVVVVSGEHTQLQQVILNLCSNAAQAMNGTGRIEVDTSVHEIVRTHALSHGDLAPGRYACIAVGDSGRGMNEATLGRIFEPFFTTRASGNGLGLATVREIVREHGGAMNVASAPGAGSRFETWLRCIAAAQPTPRDDAPAVLARGRGETLLVVDDDRERLLGDEELLAALGYEPVGFTGAGEALKSCRMAPERFDALLVGCRVPAKAALALAAALHEIVPDRPILLATASSDHIGANALMAAGVSEVVNRPLVASEIAMALRRWLDVGARRASRVTAVTHFSHAETTA